MRIKQLLGAWEAKLLTRTISPLVRFDDEMKSQYFSTSTYFGIERCVKTCIFRSSLVVSKLAKNRFLEADLLIINTYLCLWNENLEFHRKPKYLLRSRQQYFSSPSASRRQTPSLDQNLLCQRHRREEKGLLVRPIYFSWCSSTSLLIWNLSCEEPWLQNSLFSSPHSKSLVFRLCKKSLILSQQKERRLVRAKASILVWNTCAFGAWLVSSEGNWASYRDFDVDSVLGGTDFSATF